MEKYIYNESNSLWYELHDNFLYSLFDTSDKKDTAYQLEGTAIQTLSERA